MKKIIYTMSLLSLLTLPLFAQNGEMKIVPTKEPAIYKLYYSADIASDVKVTVRNADDKSVFFRKIKDKKGFILPLDFSDYQTGQYQVELFSPLFILTDSIAYTSASDKMKGNFEWEYLSEKSKVIVTATAPLDDKITVLVNDDGFNEIDKQEIPGDRFGIRVFNFDGIDSKMIYLTLYYKGKVIASREYKIK